MPPVLLRVGIAVPIAGFTASALTSHAYWAMAAAVLVLHQGAGRVPTLLRATQRLVGTLVGLGLAGVALQLHPQGLWLVLVIGLLQLTIEMVIVRNYGLAVVFITAIALTIAYGAERVGNVGGLLLDRGLDNLIGCAIAVAVYLATAGMTEGKRLRHRLSATSATIEAVRRHLQRDAVQTAQARKDRLDLQIQAFELLAAYESAPAIDLGPAVEATEEQAYRTLAACWRRS